MDYEKAYKEALKRAEAAIDIAADKDLVKGVATTIFPELRESEDERNIDTIFNCLYQCCDTGFISGTQRDNALAWLEKQKEQKPNFSEKDSTDFEIEVHEIIAQARNDSRLNDEDVLKQFEEEAAFALMLKANKLIEQQKPAEWSEEDEAMRNNILRVLSCFVGTAECESNPSLSTSYPLYRREIAWLKSLRPQYHGDVTMTEAYKMGLEAGKASSWKPSEEQMEAFRIYLYNPQYIDNSEDIKIKLVESLYNDLKKLM